VEVLPSYVFDGTYAAVKDLEFLYVFHPDGTMAESSNYDGAPPVPPAYGVWQSRDDGQYDARYIFFITKPPADFKDITSGGGWTPAGFGILTERIKLARDRRSFTSALRYEPFDNSNKPAEGGGSADVRAERITLK